MPQYLDGFPRDNGATDFGDSSRLAGVMALVNHPDTPDLSLYVIEKDGQSLGVRFPLEDLFNPGSNNPLNFTRDQLLPLMAGLHKQGQQNVNKRLLDGIVSRGWRAQNIERWEPGSEKRHADIFSPSARLAIVKSAGVKPSPALFITGYSFLLLDVLWASIMPKKFEINQTIAVAYLLGLLPIIRLIPDFKEKLTYYWGGWRNEPELAQQLIELISKA